MVSSGELERRILWGATFATCFSVLLLIISMGTDYWVIVSIPGGVYRLATKAYTVKHWSGLFRICRRDYDNSTIVPVYREYCNMLKMFPSRNAIIKDPEVDEEILNYTRSETAFACISLALMALALVFSIYSIKEPRYMFKRLAAALHGMTALAILIAVQVLISSVKYERLNLPKRFPGGASMTYGFSFGLCWIILVIHIAVAIIYLFYGRKRKGDRALTEKEADENEPVQLGRI